MWWDLAIGGHWFYQAVPVSWANVNEPVASNIPACSPLLKSLWCSKKIVDYSPPKLHKNTTNTESVCSMALPGGFRSLQFLYMITGLLRHCSTHHFLSPFPCRSLHTQLTSYKSIVEGFWSKFLKAASHCAPTAPSTVRWSQLSVTLITSAGRYLRRKPHMLNHASNTLKKCYHGPLIKHWHTNE